MDQAAVIAKPRSRARVSPSTLLRLATFLVVWALWEALAASGLLFRDVVPSSFKVVASLWELLTSPSLYHNLELTLAEVLVSMVFGTLAGIAIGLGLGASRFAGKAFEPYLHYLAPTPKIVFLPIFLVFFGVGPGSKIAMGTLSCFFPMALSVATGVRQVDPVLRRVGRSFNLTLKQTIQKIYLPALVPAIATGLKLGLGVTIIGCLLAEIKMSNRGLGFLVMQYYTQFRIPAMYAALIVAFGLAALGNMLITRFVRLPGGKR